MDIVFVFVPLIVFLGLICPLWIIFHYITKWKIMKKSEIGEGMIAIEKKDFQRLRVTAQKLETRITSLEKILDAESINWRAK